jgi:cell wall-associated NlpC family hydrolase
LSLLAVITAAVATQPAQASRTNKPPARSATLSVTATGTRFWSRPSPLRPKLSEAEAIRRVLAAAYAQLGKPYRWGAVGPNRWDCSGLTRHAWRAAGVEIPRVSRWQYRDLPHVSPKDARPGDLVFFGKPRIHHVGIYLGERRMLHAFRTGDFVKISGFVREFRGFARPQQT